MSTHLLIYPDRVSPVGFSDGVGRAFCDILNTKSVQHTGVTMTGGDNENEGIC
jgi:hypothetical protein